jgi:hypothetical protein
MNNYVKTLQFVVTVKYSSDEKAVLCGQSAMDNLALAIENERQSGTLAPVDISADWITVEEVKATQAK